jgi:hypothetical protein
MENILREHIFSLNYRKSRWQILKNVDMHTVSSLILLTWAGGISILLWIVLLYPLAKKTL